MKLIRESLENGQVLLDLDARDIRSIFHETIRKMVDDGMISGEMAGLVEAALLARDAQVPTVIGNALGIPHAYVEGVERPIVVFVRLKHAVNLGAPDGIPTRFFFFLIGPPEAAAGHLDTLASIARLMTDDEFRYEVGQAGAQQDLLDALERYIDRTAPVTEPVAPVSDGLEYTGRLFGGCQADIKRRKAHYLSDFRDGLHAKCAGSTLFLFFACLAPAVTFGGVMAVQTQGEIGVVEMILASAICGVSYALLSGQPLIILGGTGPLLIITAILFQMCGQLEIPFLPTYAWVGLWSGLLIIILAVTDASFLMRYFTRFTDEIFSALISMIFIYEAIRSLMHIFNDLDVRKQHDTALLSLLLALGTYYIATNLSRMRRSNLLRWYVREFLSDFGPTIAIVAMTLVAVWLREVDLDILPAPDVFGTTSGRPWTVDLFAVPLWVRFAAVGPAILVTVLVFLDQNITARLVNSPDHKLQKGAAYHLDLLVVGLLTGLCSLFGLPWLVAATVRSLNHVRSLATMEEVVKPGGHTHERVLHVRETRVTGIAVHLLIGLSLLLLPLLKTIPMAVLYGLFLFMGVVSMVGNQFFARMSLWLIDPDLYPTTHYTRRVPIKTIHRYTFLQLFCLAALWLVKASVLGIVFPLFIALLVPVRFLANRFFEPADLEALDAVEEPEEEETHWSG